MDSYKTLYRKYRPKTFDQVVGQEHVVQSLKNALTTGKIAHAYLFCGPKGTGKTSLAKIFASVLNCLHSGNPTKACDLCLIDSDRSFDIIEMDAASNNGVDEIRLLKDKIEQSPINSKYKIYIIDEVHMLTKFAFNALLKTLEEPPHHSIFILATTDPQKIPLTILSRVQRYNFKRMSDSNIISHLKDVLDNEKISYEEDSLKMIALLATGGMRDALSIADQASSFNDNHISQVALESNFGLSSIDNYITLLNAILKHDLNNLISLLNEFNNNGSDASYLVRALMNISKEWLLYYKTKDEGFLAWASKTQILNITLDSKNAVILYDHFYKLLVNLQNHENPYELLQIEFISLMDNLNPNTTIIPEVASKADLPPKEVIKPKLEPAIEHNTKSDHQDFFAQVSGDNYFNDKFIFRKLDLGQETKTITPESQSIINDVLEELNNQKNNSTNFKPSNPIIYDETTYNDIVNVFLYAQFEKHQQKQDYTQKYTKLKQDAEMISTVVNQEFYEQKNLLKNATIWVASKNAIVFFVQDESSYLEKLRLQSKDHNMQYYISEILQDTFKKLYFLNSSDKSIIIKKINALKGADGKIKLPTSLKEPQPEIYINPRK